MTKPVFTLERVACFIPLGHLKHGWEPARLLDLRVGQQSLQVVLLTLLIAAPVLVIRVDVGRGSVLFMSVLSLLAHGLHVVARLLLLLLSFDELLEQSALLMAVLVLVTRAYH